MITNVPDQIVQHNLQFNSKIDPKRTEDNGPIETIMKLNYQSK